MSRQLAVVSSATCKQGLQVQGACPQSVSIRWAAQAEDVAALEHVERKLEDKGREKKK